MGESVAIIPARGGSKRLPRKNILPFRGKPMIVSTINAAKEAKCFDRIIVTTDDMEFADIARSEDVEVILRGADLAGDNVTLVPVVLHILNKIRLKNNDFCMLMPNCPLRSSIDILGTRETFISKDADSAMSISSYGWTHPEWALYKESDYLKSVLFAGDMSDISSENKNLYAPSGAVRWCKVNIFLEQQSFYPRKLCGKIIPWHRAIDIDTQEDYEVACCLAHAIDHGFEFGRFR